MMALDTGIYGNLLRPPKSVAEYDAEAQTAKGNALALALRQQQVSMGEQKAAEYQRGLQEQNALRGVLQRLGSGATDEQRIQALKGTGTLAGMSQAAALEKDGLDRQKAGADISKSNAEVSSKQLADKVKLYEFQVQKLGAVSSPDQVTAWLQDAVQNGVFTPEQAQGGYKMFQQAMQAPGGFEAWRQQALQGGMSATEQLKAKAEQARLAETARGHDLSFQSATRGQDMSSATAAAGRSVTMRGQNMSDARAREFNDTKAEENSIKRMEAEKTKDLTKNSQIASFDTMLGTLDRLAKHPGLSNSVGLIGALPTMPGSESANFQAELNTFQSQAFIPMVAQLKGMGALSDAEGKKLTAAVGALDPRMGEKAFKASIDRITADMVAARERVSGTPASRPAASISSGTDLGGGFKVK